MKFHSDIPCGVSFRVSLEVSETNRGAWDVTWDSLNLNLVVHVTSGALPDGCHSPEAQPASFPKASRLSVQATKPSRVILADRKEWMMKTIGLGQE